MYSLRFGPAGISDLFYKEGFKSSVDVPKWLHKIGLNAFEYQCTHGVRIGNETAEKLGANAGDEDIALSIHGPYFINLANPDEEKSVNSKKYILQSVQAAQAMGATKVVFHPGSCGKMSREDALQLALKRLRETLDELAETNCEGVFLAPETAGKVNQLGTLDEIIAMCKLDSRIIPTIDFGHLHARGGGCLNNKDDFLRVFDKIISELGEKIASKLHIHFSPIEYTKGGEKQHHTFLEPEYGPDFTFLAEIISEHKWTPTIICESKDRMVEDALIMQETVRKLTVE